MQGRSKPYTEIGIRRMKCVRCGKPARFQWQICADDRIYRPICAMCDVKLNRMVMEWAGFSDVGAKMARYRESVYPGECNAVLD